MQEEFKHTQLNEKKWDLRAETFDNGRFNRFRFFNRKLVSLLGLKESQRLLDLGCGTGWAVRYASGVVKDKGQFYGIDISSPMIEKARANSLDYQNVHYFQANVEQLPFENDFFDFIICSNSFHHYFSPDKALSQAYRVLKPRGRIYILDVTADGFFMKMVDRWVKKKEPEHVKFYSTREYQEFFTKAGLNYVGNKSVTFAMKAHIGEKG